MSQLHELCSYGCDRITTCTGLILVKGKPGRAVQVSSSNEVVLSMDAPGATTFLLVACRAWNSVSKALRSRCISLMDTNRADWYVRHNGSHLSVESENATVNLPQFQLDSSFIMHSDKFYPGQYALESRSTCRSSNSTHPSSCTRTSSTQATTLWSHGQSATVSTGLILLHAL